MILMQDNAQVSPVKYLLLSLLLYVFCYTAPSWAMDKAIPEPTFVDAVEQSLASESSPPSGADTKNNYLADIRVHSPEELNHILMRAEMLLDDGEFTPGDSSPVVFLLHGEEARVLFKNQYSQNKQLVDLTAKLSAFNVIDVRVCETWMRKNNLSKDQLQPFIGTEKYAPATEKRLLQEEQYRYF